MKKLLSLILVVMLASSLTVSASADPFTDFFYGKGEPYGLSFPTQEEIIAKAQELGIDLSREDLYSEDYSLDAPDYETGSLAPETQQNALNILNFYRYIAGLPADVQLKDEYIDSAQAAALVLAANNTLSHYPAHPEGMSDELYDLGYAGAGSSNIAVGFENLSRATAEGWMNDSDQANIDKAGHRRWVLYPRLKYVGFGEAGKYMAMYAHDMSREGLFAGDYVAWPAPNTPVELFDGSVFSVSLGYAYDDPAQDKVSVEVSSETLHKHWTVSQARPYRGFAVNNVGYGLPKCIIFKVTDFSKADTIHVKITGLTKNGVDAPIEYTVNLFSASEMQAPQKLFVMRPYWGLSADVTAASPYDSAPDIKWTSSDSDVAIVYRSIICPFKEGEAYLTGTFKGESVTIRVVVSNRDIFLGDADGDGDVTITDATVIQRQLAGIEPYSFVDYAADADEDGDLTSIDATQLQRYLSGIPAHASIGRVMQ